jgi:hypothetical protein
MHSRIEFIGGTPVILELKEVRKFSGQRQEVHESISSHGPMTRARPHQEKDDLLPPLDERSYDKR